MSDLSEEKLRQLVPTTDAGILLSRMPREERLPRYSHTALPVFREVPEEIVEFIRSIGRPLKGP